MTQSEIFQAFDIKGISVLVKSNSNELIERVRKDFSYFKKDLEEKHYDLRIDAYLEDEISVKIPSWPEIRRSKNSVTYERGSLRINDYYGKLVSLFDYAKERGQLYSHSLEKLHEISYLLILSRTGKALDLKGLHKVHALGFSYRGVACIGMMDMGAGKSTLLMELLKNSEVELLSDDSPLVDNKGEVEAFPIRIGLSEKPDEYKNSYTLEREHYGLKHLLPIEELSNPIASEHEALILFEGVRGEKGELVKMNKFSMFLRLQRHMVIGIGLPLIFEYFWESGFRDFLRKTLIFFKRQRAAIRLCGNSKTYRFVMSRSPSENAELLLDLIEKLKVQ